MSVRQCDRVISAIARQPWAITPDGLELVMGIAQRRINDHQALLAVPTERRESGKVRMRDGVAVISIMGPIFSRADIFTEISGATSVETLALHFGEALAAEDVKGIVLHVDSPGGLITGVHEFAGQIFAARDVKPVVAYISGIGASAAYWIASAAQRVVADATAILGSIGVVATWTDDKEARKSKGLTDYEVVSSQSPNKRLDPFSEKGRSALQRHLDETAEIFIADIARHRGTSAATVTEQFGQGGIMLAAEAVKVGMADEIGSLEGVMAALSGADGGSITNRDEPSARINKESHMDKDELAKKHPELLAQIEAEAEAKAKARVEESAKAALLQSQTNVQAMVRVVAGADAAARMEQLAAAGVTAQQLEALAPLLAKNDAPASADAAAPAAPSEGMKAVLEGLRNATPAPVNTSAAVTGGDTTQATIERIAALKA